MAVLVGEQLVEIVLVIRNRFHYSMDVAMAILLTLLFFTSGPIAIVAKAWTGWKGWDKEWDDDGYEVELITKLTCHLYHTEEYSDHLRAKKLKELWKETQPPEEGLATVADIRVWAESQGLTMVPKKIIRTDGDIWIPCCCFPFCCLWGRSHIIDDDTVKLMGVTGAEVFDTDDLVGAAVQVDGS